jgi:hypothetical protein
MSAGVPPGIVTEAARPFRQVWGEHDTIGLTFGATRDDELQRPAQPGHRVPRRATALNTGPPLAAQITRSRTERCH